MRAYPQYGGDRWGGEYRNAEMSFKEIGAALGCSPQRAQQIFTGAMKKLRKPQHLRACRDFMSEMDGARKRVLVQGKDGVWRA